MIETMEDVSRVLNAFYNSGTYTPIAPNPADMDIFEGDADYDPFEKDDDDPDDEPDEFKKIANRSVRLDRRGKMQILIQVVMIDGTKSPRAFMNKDTDLPNFGLKVDSTKKVGRSDGWTKLKSSPSGAPGAINVEWDASVRILMGRVTTKGSETPDIIIGDFVRYLFARFGQSIESINIIQRG